eukprot:Nitzschia sp. Nitz4//scaffold122_size67431//34001//40615//NITZ4_006086-RA/size67431-augustus-gene-0.57-mRNA-1//-1//CDS//3329534406//1789//frame0
MEALLQQYEEEEGPGKAAPLPNKDELAQRLLVFASALREALALYKGESKQEEGGDVASAQWLLRVLAKIPSELTVPQMARAVYDASLLSDESQQQDALFAALGASEEAMEVLFELAPQLPEIRNKVNVRDLGTDSQASPQPFISVDEVDEEEIKRQRLRQEALEARQLADLALAELQATEGTSTQASTHSIARASDKNARKAAEKASKRAAQALERAIKAGAIIEESELLDVHNTTMGSGGLLGRSSDELQELQQSLLPEGTRQYYEERGLPMGATREELDEFVRVTIPPPKLDDATLHPRLRISDIMDDDCAIAFAGVDSLNPMQSAVFETAFNRRENLLVCAPTGAGKTNVAMLALTAHFRDVGLIGHNPRNTLETGAKVVYIAPMKALAQEVVEKYSVKLKPLGLIVRELTGDMQLTRAEAQRANVLVTTPEKWDVVTRKAGNDALSLGNQCGLLIIDEVHLLADERGAVIESVVARLNRVMQSRQVQIRIVGLSATLPNYQDVATFLRVPERALYFFGPEHRPVPLQQQFIGVRGKRKGEIDNAMDAACYETVVDSLKRGYQVMVFVHSRKGTGDAATALAQAAKEADERRYFVPEGDDGQQGRAYSRFLDRVKKSPNREVSNHFFNGIGIHHAGMLRGDRKLSESMFAEGAIKVLCTTATLAWGINLPAHSVVIKGTDIYNPEKGKNVDLSILDVQQIFGRAGRPQFDTSGEATLITNLQAMDRYLDKLVRAVPIESSFVKQLADHLNAEIVSGTVTDIKEAAAWLEYTYMFVRMTKNPFAYGIGGDSLDIPPSHLRCIELVESAAKELSSIKMVTYKENGNMSMTTTGRVAAHYYIKAASVANFAEVVERTETPTDVQLLRVVASATEFENVRVRQEELSELDSLQAKCQLELDGKVCDAVSKTSVLMQTYIARERIKSFTLTSDSNYIATNAGRVARAFFEMSLLRKNKSNATMTLKLLRLAKSVDRRFWWFQSPLRHFDSELSPRVILSVEKHGLSPSDILEMTSSEIDQICGSNGISHKVKSFAKMIPNPIISCGVTPVTDQVLRFSVDIEPGFEWHGRWHGGAVGFWLWVEDSRGVIMHNEQFMFTKQLHPNAVALDFLVPIYDTNAQYLIRLTADSWVGVEVLHAVSLTDTRLPERPEKYTELLNLRPLKPSALQNASYEELFSRLGTFNPIQTQMFHILYHSDTPVFLGAPTGSGKTIVAELAILRMKLLSKDGICVYIAPLKSLARERLLEWKKRFGGAPLEWNVVELSGDVRNDRRAVETADILVCTPEKWDLVSRGWLGNRFGESRTGENNGGFLNRVRLLVIDEIHLLGEERGAVLEAIVSRTRFMSRHLGQTLKGGSDSSDTKELVRIIGLSTAIQNPTDLADWIGIDTTSQGPSLKKGLFNFSPKVRPVPTKVHVQGFPGKHYCPRMATMNKPCYAAIKNHAEGRPSLIFVASRRQTRLTAFDLISYAAADDNPKIFLGCDDLYIDEVTKTLDDDSLRHAMSFGIGLHHAGLSVKDRQVVEQLYLNGDIRVLVATATLAWGVNLPARLVIVKGTEYFDGKTSRYVDYPLTDVLQMIGRAGRPGFDSQGRAVVLAEESKKDFYKKFLYISFPVESCLRGRICENLNAEIVTGTVKTALDCLGYLTWTFFARRVKANPSHYGAATSSKKDVEDFLTTVVKDTILRLASQGCVIVDGDLNDLDCELRATSLGDATCGFYLVHQTAKQMMAGMEDCAKLAMLDISNHKESSGSYFQSQRSIETAIAWLLYVLSWTVEFDELPVRHNEDGLNAELSKVLNWGPDARSLTKVPSTNRGRDLEIFGDSHTKCFLLMQAHLEKARLPISDYVNDSKMVVDNTPRLLAAMIHIARADTKTVGMFEVACHLHRTKQYFSFRGSPKTHPVKMVLGMNHEAVPMLTRSLEGTSACHNFPMWALRNLSRDDAAGILKKVPRGRLGTSIRAILDSLYKLPNVLILNAHVKRDPNIVSGHGSGILSLQLEIEAANRKEKSQDVLPTLGIVLGTDSQRRLLAEMDMTLVGGNGSNLRVVRNEVLFDWSFVQETGTTEVILRLFQDNIPGMEVEVRLSLDQPKLSVDKTLE